MARGVSRIPSGFGRRFLRSLVRGQRAASLYVRAVSTFSESPRRFDGYTRPSVARVTCLEDRQRLLGALCGIPSDHSKVLRTQLDLAGLVRHVLIVAELSGYDRSFR
jgi:hypothetical protein